MGGSGVVAPFTGHLDVALSNFAKKFRNNALISDILLPRVDVGRQKDKYYVYGRETQELLEQTLRASGAPAQRIRMSLSDASYNCASHALAADIADEDRAGYGPGQLEQDVTQTLIDKILLDKESRALAMLTTGNITNNTTLAGTSQWSDGAGSKPITDVEAGKTVIRKAGVEPTHLFMGESVYSKLIVHPSIIERFKYVVSGAITGAELSQVFGVQVAVARAVSVSKAGVADFLLGKKALLAYISPSASLADLSFGKTFVWGGAPGTAGGFGTVMGRHPDPTAKSDILGVDFYYDQKITAVETAYLIESAVA